MLLAVIAGTSISGQQSWEASIRATTESEKRGGPWETCDGEGYYFETSLRTGTFSCRLVRANICHTSPDSGALLPELEAKRQRFRSAATACRAPVLGGAP